MTTWIIIPARFGSQSIPGKNLALLGGYALIEHVARAAKGFNPDRILVSTDDIGIGGLANYYGAIPVGRPDHLTGNDVPVWDVIEDVLSQDEEKPEFVILLQPTSPFVLVTHMEQAIAELEKYPYLGSVETVTECNHNQHEYNQRILLNKNQLVWVHHPERIVCFNKQTKPPRFVFGNLIAFRTREALKYKTVFPRPTHGIPIEKPYAFDVDDAWDLKIANAMVRDGVVELENVK